MRPLLRMLHLVIHFRRTILDLLRDLLLTPLDNAGGLDDQSDQEFQQTSQLDRDEKPEGETKEKYDDSKQAHG